MMTQIDPINAWYTTFDRQVDRLAWLLDTMTTERAKRAADTLRFFTWANDVAIAELQTIEGALLDAKAQTWLALEEGDDDEE